MRAKLLLAIAACFGLSACGAGAPASMAKQETRVVINPIIWFEIPVADMDRAVRFYEGLFGFKLERTRIDGYDMALYPRHDGAAGSSGALAKGDVYVPGKTGAVLYFDVADIDAVLARATAAQARILYPKKDIGALGYVAEIEDSEGNRIALSEARA